MNKKKMWILLIISIVMIMSISAISAADKNETLRKDVSNTNNALQEDVSYTNNALQEGVSYTNNADRKANDAKITKASVPSEQEDNVTPLRSEKGNDVEKNSVSNKDELSNRKVGDGDSSNLNKGLLSASNNDMLKTSSGSFYYNGEWYDDLDDAVDEACDNNGGEIKIKGGTYGSDSDDVKITISDGVNLIFSPYDSGQVIFDGSNNDKWFFVINDDKAKVTFNNITFRNGGAFQGGAIEVDEGKLNLNDCTFEGNKAFQNLAGGYGWGGAIFLDDDKCSLIATNCRFINNKAASGGGAVCVEGDGSKAEFYNCYFEGNKQGDDENDVYDKDSGTHSFSYCSFIGHGSIEYEVNYADKSVTIYTLNVGDDDANFLALYHYGEFYTSIDCNPGSTKTFSDLEDGSYTIYMMHNEEKRYIYKDASFRIVANDFILDDNQPFKSLSAAVNAIPDGGTGVITVNGGIYTESENFNVEIKNNKKVTIRPRDGSLEPVIFSANSDEYNLLEIQENCHLTMEEITVTGKFTYALYFQDDSQGIISDCEFKNIVHDEPGHPIGGRDSNIVLNDCTFESNGNIYCTYSTLNINDCTFTDNSAQHGGAIWAPFSNITVTGSTFSGNHAWQKGGAIYAPNLKIYDTDFTGNSADMGGAIYIDDANSIINITGCVFDSNIATGNYRNIYSDSLTREINLEYNEYDLNLTLKPKDDSYGREYILEGTFDWGSNLNNNYAVLMGIFDDETVFGDLLTIGDNKFKINMGVLSGGSHNVTMPGMYVQGDRLDYFYGGSYYSDLYGNEFYLNNIAFAKILIDRAKITLNLEVKDVLIPETPVLNVYANWDLNYTICVGNKYYQLEVVNGKGSMHLTGLDLGNYTVVVMRDADENYNLAMNFTTFSISKTYSNFIVLSTNVEYDTLSEAVANSNHEDTIYVKNGTYADTGIIISDKALDIIALEGAVFDAQGRDANFIIVNENAVADIYGITFRGLRNRNTNYGAIVNHGYLSLDSCNFTDNKITKTSFAGNGGAAIFNDGYSLEIDNCNFINNVAPLRVSTAAVTSLGYDDVSITSSKFINNSAREGGALHFKNIAQYYDAIISCEFEQNIAVKGSAIYIGKNSKYLGVTLSSFKKNDIKNNLGENTQLEGGVIYVNANNSEVNLNIDLSNFEGNSNRNVDGGVICLDGSSNTNIESCIFNNNLGKVGSAILIKNPYNKKLTLSIDGSNFINNHATIGAIATSPKVTTLIDECIFANNTGENRHIYSNGFTIVHDSIFDVEDVKLKALSVKYGENSIISGTADIGTNLYSAANLTVADEKAIVEIKNKSFTYKTGILNLGKYHAVLNNIVDNNNNTYLMDSITEIFRVKNVALDLDVSVDNITYGETIKVIEKLPPNVIGTIDYQLNGKNYTKEEIESLKLDAGKYQLVATYNHEDFTFTPSIINFTVYKANPTISVADVEVEYNDTIILNIETNVPSIYLIEIGDYKTATLINGSKSVKIEETFEPGTYTIKVTSRERVNYISNFTEAILKVNKNIPVSSAHNTPYDDSLVNIGAVSNEETPKLNLNSRSSPNNNNLGDEYEEEGNFIFQYDEDDDYEYFDSLEEAIEEAEFWGAGIITVRGGTYSGYGFCGIYLEGELEVTIKAYEGEEVIFDCENDDYFMHLTYETVVEPSPNPPLFFETYQTEGPTVTLDHITVINGCAINGGAIDMDAGTLILTNCTFRNNNANCGGAIYIGSISADESATVIGYNTTFTNNYASDEGGAIFMQSPLQYLSASFYLCTFLDNHQGEDEYYTINYYAGSQADDIESKYCIFNGEGTINSFDIDKIEQTVTVNGTSTDTFDSVVLLYFDQVPLYSIYNNGYPDFNVIFEDVMGGNYTLGVMDEHDFNTYIFDVKFEMKVPNFIISEDEVYENLTDAIDAVAEYGTIYANGNYYTEENMEIDIHKSFTLKNFRNREVIFDGCSEKWFFTIDEGRTVVFDGIYFTDGAIKTYATIENYGTLKINNCSFDSFETSEIIHNSDLLNILNSTFSLNFVDNALVWNDAKLYIEAVEFSNNIINLSSVVYTNGVTEIVSSNFTENYNGGNGGAIYNTNSLSVKGTVFNENEGKDGGAVYNAGILQVLNSTFGDNSANGYGGAIFNGNELNIIDSTFTGGFSEKDGGAIYNNNTMAVDNSTFVGNSATGNGGAIYNKGSLVLTKSLFGINFAEEFANIYNAGDIQFSENIFDFYDVILIVPDGQYGIPTTITGTLNPEFNMDIQVTLPEFVDNKDATVTVSDGIFEYVTYILPKGIYPVKLNEVIYDSYSNIYYGESISDRLIIHKANVNINLTVDDIVLHGATGRPELTIDASQNGLIYILFNNKISNTTITDGHATITLDAVGAGNYSVSVTRFGDENHNDAVNTTTFKVSKYEGKFVNSGGNEFETLRDALADSSDDDIIYVREGTYSGADNLGLIISDKKLTIIALGDVVFDANSTDLSFLTVKNSEVTICNVVITGFNAKNKSAVIDNEATLTVDGCTFVNNNLNGYISCPIITGGTLNVLGSGFYNNILDSCIIACHNANLIINESTFENNTINSDSIILITNVDSAKIIETEFSENNISSPANIIKVVDSDILINAMFYNNTQSGNVIYADGNSNLLVNNSIFIGNTLDYIINSKYNKTTISGCVFTDNTVKNVVLSNDKNLSVFESAFSDNTLSEYGALNIASNMNATVNGSVFSNNKAKNYRNIYSVCDVNISNSAFDAINVDYSVHDIDYGQNETIEGSIDIGTNLKFTVNLDINSNNYPVNITDNKFTCNAGILNGGDYKAILNAKDDNSNSYIFNKITKIFTVNRVNPKISISIADITQGEKLKVNLTINKDVTGHVVYELNGKAYTKAQLENLTLDHGNYLVTAMYRGDKNYLSSTKMVGVEVRKIAPNITVSDVAVDYNKEVKINVTVDVPDYYTVFVGNESIIFDKTLYVEDNATFKFPPSAELKPGNYTIKVYVFETDDYAEAYAYANLTVNKATGYFNLSNDIIKYGENATISVKVPVNANGNITYNVYDKDMKLVYSITQSCLKELVVPNLSVGRFNVTGNYSGDSYYTNESIINYGKIFVNTKDVDLNIIVSNITYGENATVNVKSNVDGDYIVYVGNKRMVVTVIGGAGNVSVSNLNVGNYVVNITALDNNYFAFNETVFEVTPKSVSVVVSVEDIEYGKDAIVNITAEVDGEYIVKIYDQNYTVNVVDGKGNTTISGLTVNNNILITVTIDNGNYSAHNTTTFNVVPKQIPVTISVENITYGENAVVTVQSDVDGDYIVTIRDIDYNVSVNGGTGVKIIPNLSAGNQILATVKRNDKYNALNKTTFNIKQKQTNVEITIKDITYGENATINITAEVDGEYLVYVDDNPYTVNVENGIGHITVDDLTAGNHIANVTTIDDNYSGFDSTIFNVVKERLDIDINFENKNWRIDPIILKLPANAGGYVSLYINGILSKIVKVVNGSAVISVSDLIIGDNIVNVVYSGDDNYDSVNKSVVINRRNTIIAFDMTRGYNSGLDYTAQLIDDNGFPVANVNVIIKADTIIYGVQTDSNGVFRFNNRLTPGDHAIAIVNPITGEYKLTNLKIVGRITGNKDVAIFFADKSNYKVRVIGDDGNYVGAGEVVKINVEGKTYSVVTDKNGYAKLKLSLKVKKYTITVTYKGFTTKNKIKVKSVVKPLKKTVKVKKTAKKLKIKVKLKGRKVLKKKRVYMKFKGKKYKAKTNKKGIATFNVSKKVIKKLKKGKKYKATFTYKAKANGKTMKNTAKCYVKAK